MVNRRRNYAVDHYIGLVEGPGGAKMQIVENPCDRNWLTPDELEARKQALRDDDDFETELDFETSEIGGCGPAGCRDGRGPDGVWRPSTEAPCCEADLWVNYDPEGWERKLRSFRPMPPVPVSEIPQPEVQSRHDHAYGLVRRPMPKFRVAVSRMNEHPWPRTPEPEPVVEAPKPEMPKAPAKNAESGQDRKRRPRRRKLVFKKERHPKHGWRYSCLKGKRLYVADIQENITPGVEVRCEEVRSRRARNLFIIQVRVID